jgi:hypothetical protein
VPVPCGRAVIGWAHGPLDHSADSANPPWHEVQALSDAEVVAQFDDTESHPLRSEARGAAGRPAGLRRLAAARPARGKATGWPTGTAEAKGRHLGRTSDGEPPSGAVCAGSNPAEGAPLDRP